MKVEWLIVADAAQVVGNKLYLLGGGWDVLTVNSGFPFSYRFSVATSFKVLWNETNQRHNFEIEVFTEDGETLTKVGGQVEVGRPPGIRPGQEQRMQLAADFGVELKGPGTYAVVARLEGQEDARTQFHVVPGPMLGIRTGTEGKGGL